MSAYIVSKRHIDYLVNEALLAHVACNHGGEWHTMEVGCCNYIGQMLVDQCLASVKHRYPKDNDAELPGPVPQYWQEPYMFQPQGPYRLSPVQVLKAIQCYEYQSCEHPVWEVSDAREWCQLLMARIVQTLPGYEEAAWDLE